ncbi:hypothetical protein [uncultured Sulfitobacter sp.]|uniref:hypothetical protein n=1 Tax=uncultured Sulfitobacter sp. TaxID=191468 RepID=UPI0026309F18|nr:hypothetical protein [uncultured Sulfitobacter sp.]
MELGILSLLMGVGLLTAFSSGSDDVEAEQERPEPPDVEPPTPPASSTVLVGSDADDQLEGNNLVNRLFGLGGDDDLSFDNYRFPDFISDESGNFVQPDVPPFVSEAYGGEGNDTLSSELALDEREDGTVRLFGGAGDDHLQASDRLGLPDRSTVVQELTGGSGEDVFEIRLSTESFDRVGLDAELTDVPRIFLTDFTPERDTLDIVANEFPTPPLDTAELTRDDSGLTLLHLRFMPLGDAPASTSTVALGNAEGITLDDINLPGEGSLLPNENNEVFGTQGDDVLNEGIESGNYWDINLGAGDDLAEIQSAGPTVRGGDGNDTIRGGFQGFIYGEAGDDLLEGAQFADGGTGDDTLRSTNGMRGGEGNDVLEGRADSYADQYGIFKRMSGDAGDDTLIVNTSTSQSGSGGFFVMDVLGNEGSDTFDIQLQLANTDMSASDAMIALPDFDPREDTLRIQINRADGDGRVMTGAQIVTRDFGFEELRQTEILQGLQMDFAASATAPAHTAFLRLNSDNVITIDDVLFVQN